MIFKLFDSSGFVLNISIKENLDRVEYKTTTQALMSECPILLVSYWI